jgi:hypothetical protein
MPSPSSPFQSEDVEDSEEDESEAEGEEEGTEEGRRGDAAFSRLDLGAGGERSGVGSRRLR